MGEQGDIVPLPDRTGGDRSESVLPDEVMLPEGGVIHPARSWRELVAEGVLLAPNLLKLIYRLLRDRRVPMRRKIVVGGVLAYLVSPIDIIPDAIPVAGQVDDVLLIAFAVNHLIEAVGRDVVLEYWDGSEDALDVVAGIVEWGAELVPAPVRRMLGRS